MSDTYYYGQVCLQHHNLLNYRTDLFKTNIFIKLMFRHWWQSPLFLFIPCHTKIVFNRND